MKEKKYKGIFPHKEKYTGVYMPTAECVTFTREWSGHVFTDKECEALLKGETITFDAFTKSNLPYRACGSLQRQVFSGCVYWGFAQHTEAIPKEWSGHIFTNEEYDILQKGGSVFISDAVSKKDGIPYECNLTFGEYQGRKRLIPQFV